MGVIHKLKQKIVDFILSAKEKDPTLSCRKLVPLIKKKFRVRVSKSSVNNVLKGTGSSAPIGRHLEAFVDCAGAFFLLGADTLMKGSSELTAAVKNKLKELPENTIQAYCQALIFMPIFGVKQAPQLNQYKGQGLWSLTGLKYDRFLPSKINQLYSFLQDRKLYYDIAFRTVSLYTHLTEFEPNFPKEETIDSELESLLFNIHKHAQHKFFSNIFWGLDLGQMWQRFYSLGGFLRRSKSDLFIRFNEYKHLDQQFDIAAACRKFNEAEIKSAAGHTIRLQPLI